MHTPKQKITDEFKDYVNNEVKAWKKRKKDKISFKEIFEQMESENGKRSSN